MEVAGGMMAGRPAKGEHRTLTRTDPAGQVTGMASP
jgi:hypothetical protein